MRILILVLIMSALLQTTILPLDLVLMILLLRSLIKSEKINLYLAFGFGLLISHLSVSPLGLYSIFYLIFAEICQLMAKSTLSANVLVVVPVTVLMLVLNNVLISFILGQTIEIWPKILYLFLLSIPTYIILRFWEERFIIKPEIRLRV